MAATLAGGHSSPARRAVPAGLLPSPSSLLKQLAADLIAGFFRTMTHWVASGTIWLLTEAWHFMSVTTEPVLTGTAFAAEFHVMILIGLGTVAPLLGLAVIQAIARQDASGLLRTMLLRLPMALLLTGVVVELVSVGLRFTDQASVALLTTGGDPAARAFARIEAALGPASPGGFGFGELLLILVVAIVGFVLWVELAVRSAAVAVATLFLPLALAGLVWPATSHWARRLGETLAGLVLMKLVMAAVLALAGGALAAGAGGISSIVEGLALLALATLSPFVLFRLIPIVESGAVAHLEGARPAQMLKSQAWSFGTGQGSRAAPSGSGAGSALDAAVKRLPVAGASLTGGGTSGPAGAGASSSGARAPAGGGTSAAASGSTTPSAGAPSGVGGTRAGQAADSAGQAGDRVWAPIGEAGWSRRIARHTSKGTDDSSRD
ncbi:MAG: hypothetical protein ABSE47_09595 [Acidimicrobiales bacterium]